MEIRYGPDRPEHTGYSGNISTCGLMIRTTRVFGRGTVLHIEMKTRSGAVTARARVVWAREGSLSLISTGRIGMGLRWVETPPELMNLLQATQP